MVNIKWHNCIAIVELAVEVLGGNAVIEVRTLQTSLLKRKSIMFWISSSL